MVWQDIMIRYFGKMWLYKTYNIGQVGKLAERIVELEEELEDIKYSFDSRDNNLVDSRSKEINS